MVIRYDRVRLYYKIISLLNSVEDVVKRIGFLFRLYMMPLRNIIQTLKDIFTTEELQHDGYLIIQLKWND